MKPIILLFSSLLFPILLGAQTSTWREHNTKAIDHFNDGRFTEAGMEYEKAWKKKKKKLSLIYAAGEAYYLDKEFRRSAKALENIKDENKTFDMVGLMYARALKQDEQYPEATTAFLNFLQNYNGPKKVTLSKIIQNEIKGCDLAMELQGLENDDYKISHEERFNSEFIEFGPRAYTDETIYYSTTKDGNAKLLRSHYKNGQWTSPEKPKGFRKFKHEHFGNGNFSPDGKRMYFTKCKEIHDRTGQYTECEIFMVKKDKNEWGSAIRLRDYINIEGYTSTQPTIAHKDGKEIIYFASNRKGGRGGMDIWYMSRDINKDDIDFSLPKNCGKEVNGPGDEITPFFDEYSGALFFSSNGHPGLGGFDIFESHGSLNDWTPVENMGIPLNSSVDDYYYTHAPSRSGGFFVSTRKLGTKKKKTDEDIFSFKVKNHEGLITGNIETLNGKVVQNVVLSLYEVLPNGDRRFLSKVVSEDGDYSFVLLPNKNFDLEIEKEGYDKIVKSFSTSNDGSVKDFDRIIVLDSNEAFASVDQPTKKIDEEITIVKKKPTKRRPVKTTEVSRPMVKTDYPNVATTKETVTTNNPVVTRNPVEIKREPVSTYSTTQTTTSNRPTTVFSGTVVSEPIATTSTSPSSFDDDGSDDRGSHLFKVQITSGPNVNFEKSRFKKIESQANISTEPIPGQEGVRVFMNSYDNVDDARKDMELAKRSGFKRAFIAEYYGNDRVKRIIR